MAAKKQNIKEEAARLRQELQDLWARFAAQKEDLKANYQKQVDDMFFYKYRCYMKKHGVANSFPSFSADDDDEDEFWGCPTQGDEHASRGDSSSEWA